MPDALLEARDIRQEAGGRTVLDVPSLVLNAGDRLAVVGPNGAGKSTLLRILALLEEPARGTVALAGRPLVGARDRRGARLRISLVEQRPFLFRGGVLDNVAYGPLRRGVPREESARRARAALAARDAGALSVRPTFCSWRSSTNRSPPITKSWSACAPLRSTRWTGTSCAES